MPPFEYLRKEFTGKHVNPQPLWHEYTGNTELPASLGLPSFNDSVAPTSLACTQNQLPK